MALCIALSQRISELAVICGTEVEAIQAKESSPGRSRPGAAQREARRTVNAPPLQDEDVTSNKLHSGMQARCGNAQERTRNAEVVGYA